ncbi:hypothetical protein [Borrelia sp. RT1S]|uniref:hypothetical protein n=1 Tax=Borrelia sp. RT1S TaxID=2898580 RepID=UPI001E656CB7|nr:hypothetical protein [Borrelia sp. RT1S]UGQ17063.1 hypothetical protein LSO05_01320 [Borrelia sp. RT1S]
MKGFLAIRLSGKDYFQVLGLEDISVKKVVLGKLLDATNVKLDFYVSEFENFPNPVLLGSFFLDGLTKESSDINVYFKVDSEILYVYGECGGFESKVRFDLSLLNLGINSGEFDGEQLKDMIVPDAGDLDIRGGVSENLDGMFEQDKDNSSSNVLDNVDNLPNTGDLYSLGESSLVNEENLEGTGSPNTGDDSSSALELESGTDLKEVDVKLEGDIFDSDGSSHTVNELGDLGVDAASLDGFSSVGSEISFDSNNYAAGFAEDEDIDFSSINIADYRDADDLSVDDIIADIDKDLEEGVVDDVFWDDSKGFGVGIGNEQLNTDLREGFARTFMLYLSLTSLFLLMFFSLLLIFSKVLNPRNLGVSYHCVFEEGKIEKYERSSRV